MIDDVFVIPDVKNQTAGTQIVLRRHAAAEAWQGELTVRARPVTGGATCKVRGTVRFAAGERESEQAVIDVRLEEMRAWSPEDPFLYRVEVRLLHEGKSIGALTLGPYSFKQARQVRLAVRLESEAWRDHRRVLHGP